MKELAPGHFIAKQSPLSNSLIIVIALLFALLMYKPDGDLIDHMVLIGIPLLFALYALIQLLLRAELRINTDERAYAWRPSSLPGSKTFQGDLDEHTKGIQLKAAACGRRKACVSGWQVVLVFRTHLREFPLDTWLDRREAIAAWQEWSQKLELPQLDELGRVIEVDP